MSLGMDAGIGANFPSLQVHISTFLKTKEAKKISEDL